MREAEGTPHIESTVFSGRAGKALGKSLWVVVIGCSPCVDGLHVGFFWLSNLQDGDGFVSRNDSLLRNTCNSLNTLRQDLVNNDRKIIFNSLLFPYGMMLICDK